MKSLPVVIAAFLALVGAISLVPQAQADGGQSFGLQPVTFDAAAPETQAYFIFNSDLGASVHSQVSVTNTGTAAGTVRLYSVDALTGQTSGTVYQNEQAGQKEVGSWITLDQSELTLQPGQSQVIDFAVAVPGSTWPGQHVGGIVAEDVVLKKAQSSSAVNIQVRNLAIVAVQVNLPGTITQKLEATDVTAGGSAGNQSLLIGITNSGNTLLKPEGTLTVSDASGKRLQKLSFKMDTFLPRSSIDFPVYIETESLPAGSYTTAIVLLYGDPQQQGNFSFPFTITAAQIQQVFPARAPLAPPPAAEKQGQPALQRKAPSGLGAGALLGIMALAVVLGLGGGYLVIRASSRRKPPATQ